MGRIIKRKILGMLLMGLIAMGGGLQCGCSKEDPEGEHGNHRQELVDNGAENNNSGNGGENGGSGENGGTGENGGSGGSETGEEEENLSPIVGEWIEAKAGEEKLIFDKDGNYRREQKDEVSSEWVENQEGNYTYNDTTRWLWLSIRENGETYMKEYRCKIDDTQMKLTDTGGKSSTYIKVKY